MTKYSTKTKLDIEANVRDGNCCVHCNKDTGIETHHIVPDIEELENLITLCHGCHKKEHNMVGCFKLGFDFRRKNLAKLTEDQVKVIKIELNNGIKSQLLAKRFKVADRTIRDIKNKKTWRSSVN